MNSFFLEETAKLPKIEGDIEQGTLSIVGKSIPEDAVEIYLPFHRWFQNFCKKAPENIVIIFDLEYFNTSTSKILLVIMKKLNDISSNRNISMTWFYEEGDVEMEETGLDYQIMVGDSLVIKSKPNEYA